MMAASQLCSRIINLAKNYLATRLSFVSKCAHTDIQDVQSAPEVDKMMASYGHSGIFPTLSQHIHISTLTMWPLWLDQYAWLFEVLNIICPVHQME